MGFKTILQKAFPVISMAAQVGGPATALAANFVGSALGVKVEPDKLDDTVEKAFLDPESRLKLVTAENNLKIELEKLNVDLEKIAADDRASARAREIAVKDKTPAILAYGILGGLFLLVGLMAFHAVPQESREVISVMIGSLATMAIGVKEYFFGSSSGSAAKTAILSEQLKK